MRAVLKVVALLASASVAAQVSDRSRPLGDHAVRGRKDVKVECPTPKRALIGKRAPPLEIARWYPSAPATRPGKLRLIDFWAMSCAPCVASIPKVQDLATGFSGDLEVVLVHPPEGVRVRTGLAGFRVVEPALAVEVMPGYLRTKSITLPVGIADQRNLDAFGVHGVPLYVVIDRAGIVRYQSCVLPSREVIERLR